MHTLKKFIHYYGPYKVVFFIDAAAEWPVVAVVEGAVVVLDSMQGECLRFLRL